MKIEQRPIRDFNCPLKHIEIEKDCILNTGVRHDVTGNLTLKLPNVETVELKSLIGVRQISGESILVDRYSHYLDKGSPFNTFELKEGIQVVLQLQNFIGKRRWIIVDKKTISTKRVIKPKSIPESKVEVKYIKGDMGKPGPRGDIGPQGPPGPRGIIGKKGNRGIKGRQGQRGLRGHRGLPGINGTNGKDGINADSFLRLHIPGEIIFCDDLHNIKHDMSYRYFGKDATIKRVIIQMGYNFDRGGVVLDLLINDKISPFKHPLTLHEGQDICVTPKIKENIVLRDGDKISIPCIVSGFDTTNNLLILIEYTYGGV